MQRNGQFPLGWLKELAAGATDIEEMRAHGNSSQFLQPAVDSLPNMLQRVDMLSSLGQASKFWGA